MSRVVVVEDEPSIAELIAINLRHSGFEVALATTGEQAHDEINRVLPDLVVLDWMLPGQSGLSLAKRWRADSRTRDLPIIMLTARATEADKVSGLDGGVDDYLTKPFSTKELLARVRAVLRRKRPHALDAAIEIGSLRLDPPTHRATCNGRNVKLGPTEFRLLHFFMTHPLGVHTRAQLLDRVWGEHVFIEERTVDVHVKRLRDALTSVSGAHWIETERGVGYRLAPEAQATSDRT